MCILLITVVTTSIANQLQICNTIHSKSGGKTKYHCLDACRRSSNSSRCTVVPRAAVPHSSLSYGTQGLMDLKRDKAQQKVKPIHPSIARD